MTLIRLWILVGLSLLLVACGGADTDLPAASPEQLAQGELLYEAHCASCHGLAGEGQPNWQEPNEDGSFPAPPHDATGHTWHHSDQHILMIMAEGGQGPTSRMPAFADKLSPEEMEAVLAYIKGFWSDEQRAQQAEITRQKKIHH